MFSGPTILHKEFIWRRVLSGPKTKKESGKKETRGWPKVDEEDRRAIKTDSPGTRTTGKERNNLRYSQEHSGRLRRKESETIWTIMKSGGERETSPTAELLLIDGGKIGLKRSWDNLPQMKKTQARCLKKKRFMERKSDRELEGSECWPARAGGDGLPPEGKGRDMQSRTGKKMRARLTEDRKTISLASRISTPSQ